MSGAMIAIGFSLYISVAVVESVSLLYRVILFAEGRTEPAKDDEKDRKKKETTAHILFEYITHIYNSRMSDEETTSRSGCLRMPVIEASHVQNVHTIWDNSWFGLGHRPRPLSRPARASSSFIPGMSALLVHRPAPIPFCPA